MTTIILALVIKFSMAKILYYIIGNLINIFRDILGDLNGAVELITQTLYAICARLM